MELECDVRGAVITPSSLWLLDGRGHYRRTARAHPPAGACGSDALTYDAWVTFDSAALHESSPFELRLNIVPSGRRPGSVGLLSGPVLWTNLADEVVPPGWFGPSDLWFAPSPVPADRDLWPGELPFTAFGQFGPESLDLRVFDQDVWWVDRHGSPHRLSKMSPDYRANVVAMLTARCAEFHRAALLRESMQALGDTLLGRPSASLLLSELGIGSTADSAASVWLESTPLLRRLRRLGV